MYFYLSLFSDFFILHLNPTPVYLHSILQGIVQILSLFARILFLNSVKPIILPIYAFPLDSPRIMPVAIRWATLRGSGILLLIEVRRMIFSAFFAPIPAFWI